MIPNQRFRRKMADVALNAIGLISFMLFFLPTNMAQAQCEVTAGTLGTPQLTVSGNNVSMSAEVTEAATAPEGLFHWFLLSTGPEQVIEHLSTAPSFEIEGEGTFTIHSFVFDLSSFDFSSIKFGQTTIASLDTLLVQGGGTVCAALDLIGASVELYGPGTTCGAFAGTLRVDPDICLSDSAAMVEAMPLIPANIPEGFVQTFLLASGDTALIQQAANDSAVFVVPQGGSYSIHSFVYDSTTFDIDSIQTGVTTIGMLDTWLAAAGTDLCAGLDTTGASFDLVNCPPVCQADAGSLVSDDQECLSDNTKRVNALHLDAPIVPEGFSKTYLLTSAENDLVRGVSGEPFFILEGEGAYNIHTFVFDTAAYDLDSIIIGTTRLEHLIAPLIQGGGENCGALDTLGATVTLEECPCLAAAGQLAPSDACLDENRAVLEATLEEKGVVPEGYEQIFILTSGEDRIVEQTMNEPYFEVDQEGLYTIHHLVYHPGSLPLGWIQFGETPLEILNAFLEQGGGDICAALSLEGAVFDVSLCQEELLSPVTYPNPVREELTVVIPDYLDQKEVTVQVVDAFGNMSLSQNVAPGLEQLRLNVAHLPEGLYHVRLLYGHGRVSISKVYIMR